MGTVTLKDRTGKVSRAERGRREAMLRRADEVSIYAGSVFGFTPITKKRARKVLKAKGSLVIVREVPELGMMFIEPCPF